MTAGKAEALLWRLLFPYWQVIVIFFCVKFVNEDKDSRSFQLADISSKDLIFFINGSHITLGNLSRHSHVSSDGSFPVNVSFLSNMEHTTCTSISGVVLIYDVATSFLV
jgi:hypothetical protein